MQLKNNRSWIFGCACLLVSLGSWWWREPFFGQKPEWISAFAAVISAVGVIFVWMQLITAKDIAQLQFEDGLAKEYRELVSRIPTDALLGSGLSPKDYKNSFDELFRYIDLSNEQVFLRKSDRITENTWKNWNSGIQYNLSLPVFRRAWEEVKEKSPKQFAELKELEKKKFSVDPKSWAEED